MPPHATDFTELLIDTAAAPETHLRPPAHAAAYELQLLNASAWKYAAVARASPQGLRVAADVANHATGGAVIIHYPVQDGTG